MEKKIWLQTENTVILYRHMVGYFSGLRTGSISGPLKTNGNYGSMRWKWGSISKNHDRLHSRKAMKVWTYCKVRILRPTASMVKNYHEWNGQFKNNSQRNVRLHAF